MAGAQRRAIFLDRDGTLIEDVGYPDDPDQVRLLPGAAEALARLQSAGYCLVLVSNQSGIGRGLVTLAQAAQVHQRLVDRLSEHGLNLDGVYYCPHAPGDGCSCRKPSPLLLQQAARDLDLDLAHSLMIGDKASDIEAGQRAGCRTLLFGRIGLPEESGRKPDGVATGWPEAVEHILACLARPDAD